MHYTINSFTFILRIGYKLEFEGINYKVKTTEPCHVARKEFIHARFKEFPVDRFWFNGNTSRVLTIAKKN